MQLVEVPIQGEHLVGAEVVPFRYTEIEPVILEIR